MPRNRPTKILGSLFRPGSAGNFTGEIGVQDATSSTNVSNVGIGIQRTSVHFPADSNQIRQKMCPERREHLHLTNPLPHPALSRPLSTPIKVDKLQFYLEGYPARSKQYLLDGFSFGFSIDHVGPRQNFSSKNLISAITNPTAVDAKLDKEIDLGRIVGPFDTRPFSVFHISPLGLIPKKLPGEFRLIHHLSFPEGHAINSYIPKFASSVHYANIDDAIRLVRRSGRGCALAKTDIKKRFSIDSDKPF